MLPLYAGCTSIGLDHPSLLKSMNFGPPEVVHLCVFLDNGIDPRKAQELLTSWDDESVRFGLTVKVVSCRQLPRKYLFHTDILREAMAQKLTAPCDRVLYFVNRDFGDFVWGDILPLLLPVPEVLGEVDDATFTHGFVFATTLTFTQIALPPYAVTRHELFHLMGCRRHFDMPGCYRSIQRLKLREAALVNEGYFRKTGEPPFYPTWDGMADTTLDSRQTVNEHLGQTQGGG